MVQRAFRGSYRLARRAVVAVVGSTVLAIGVAMILLPGPAVVVIPVGLGILALEFAWARRLLARVRSEAGRARDRLIPRREERQAPKGPGRD